jgi:hypothetical protein
VVKLSASENYSIQGINLPIELTLKAVISRAKVVLYHTLNIFISMTDDQPAYSRIKLHRLHAIAGWIARPRLLDKFDQVLQKPIALISAPAGSGETTRLTQGPDRGLLPNTWLQLEENDHVCIARSSVWPISPQVQS